MSDKVVYSVADSWSASAWVNQENYQAMYKQSIEDPSTFWLEQSNLFITGNQPWNLLNKVEFEIAQTSWFVDGK